MDSNEKTDSFNSIHSFIYTFTYEIDETIAKSDSLSNWKIEDSLEKLLKEKNDTAYNVSSYFTSKARKSIFNFEKKQEPSNIKSNKEKRISEPNAICENYRYNFEEKSLQYVIITKEKEYSLDLLDIKLAIFPQVNIGIITMNMEDPINNLSGIPKIERAMVINGCGRRLFFPSISKEGNSFINTQSLVIRGTNGKDIVYASLAEQYQNNHLYDIQPVFIDRLLGDEIKRKYQFSKFHSVLDDRMFACCYVNDTNVIKDLKKYNYSEKEYACYLPARMELDAKHNTSGLLYAYSFIDSSLDDCTCQNIELRKEKLKDHIYARWIDYGTIYGFNEYAMTCISGVDNKGTYDILRKSFLTQYIEMAKLCLMQRACINVIENDIVEACKLLQDSGNKGIEQVTKAWKKYIIFQSELFLPEVTFQEQGVEIYAYLKKFLKINELQEKIGNEMDNLHEYTDVLENKREAEHEGKVTSAMNYFSILLGAVAITDIWGFIDLLLCANKDVPTLFPIICETSVVINLAKLLSPLGLLAIITVIICRINRKP